MEPIYINLSGEYLIPDKARAPVVGSIDGDLRLASLDAFLHTLREAATSPETQSKFEQALSTVMKQCANGRVVQSGLTLAITSKLTPKTNEITYNFTLTTKEP